MANFKEVNQYIKKNFPKLDIQAVRGEGYVYFTGDDGFDKIPSIMTHPVSTSTSDLVDMCFADIQEVYLHDPRCISY